ncbi:MAG TPA: peptidoglycan DD-metalloendopeptidase family protein, partial [Sphingobacteriaceae bacterium]
VESYKQAEKVRVENENLVNMVSDLKSKLPDPADSLNARTYIQKIETKLQKINSYLKKRGVRGFSDESVGGGEEIDNLTILERYSLYDEHLDKVFSGLVSTPTGFPGRPSISSNYGYRTDPFNSGKGEFHSGVDFKGNNGDHVRNTASGVVISAGWYNGYGNCVRIRHKGGYETLYGHLSAVKVKAGQKVDANEVIGLVGSTGRSTGNHLHYEVRKNGKVLDPEKFLRVH